MRMSDEKGQGDSEDNEERLTILLHCMSQPRLGCTLLFMGIEKRDRVKALHEPSALDVYFGLIEVLKRAGARDPGGSVSCRQAALGAHPCYLIAAESYMAARVELALSKLLQRPISFDEKAGITLSTQEALVVAGRAAVNLSSGRS